MKCDESEVLLHALIDGELDAGHAREVEACGDLFGLRRKAHLVPRHARGHERRCAEGGRAGASAQPG